MLYFFVNIPNQEIIQLQKKLPRGSFCLFQIQGGSSRYYGLMKNDAREIFKENLSNETLQNLEYLDKNVFRMFFLQNINDSITCIGNRAMLMHLSDES